MPWSRWILEMTRASGYWGNTNNFCEYCINEAFKNKIDLGLVVEPSKLYSQQVPSSFKVTMASLGSNKELEATTSGKSQRTSLIFNLDNKEDFTICSLINEKIEQQPLDLVFTEGETIAFRVDGPNAIHLSGYYVDEEEEEDGFINDDEEEVYSDEAEEDSQIEYDSDLEDEDFDESDSEVEIKSKKNPRIRVLESDEEEEDSDFDSEEYDSEMDSEDDGSDMEDSEAEDSEEESEEEVVKSAKKVKFDLSESKKTPEPVKAAVKEAPKATVPAKDTPKTTTPTKETAKVTPPPAKAAPATPAATPVAKPASPQTATPASAGPVKKTLPSGLQIEDLKLGNGPKANQGKKVMIHYKGTLLNGSVFDSSFGGSPLKFTVGKAQVIKGMDMGIVGMAVGGTRKLTIPGPLAYGNQALPKIPRNSTLVFEIRLEKIL